MLPSSKNSPESDNSENCNLIVFINVKKTYNIDVVKGKPKPITVEIDVDSQVSVYHKIYYSYLNVISILLC